MGYRGGFKDRHIPDNRFCNSLEFAMTERYKVGDVIQFKGCESIRRTIIDVYADGYTTNNRYGEVGNFSQDALHDGWHKVDVPSDIPNEITLEFDDEVRKRKLRSEFLHVLGNYYASANHHLVADLMDAVERIYE